MRVNKDEVEIKAKVARAEKAMNDSEVVTFEGRPYYIQALRLPKTGIYGVRVYQAELVSVDPARWNSVILVALEKVIIDGD